VLQPIRRSLALKLILASALPSAAVLLCGLFALIWHTEPIARTRPEVAFSVLREGAVAGALLVLLFAAGAVALATRRLLLKPLHGLVEVMRRAESGDVLVRAKVESDDEVGSLARSFNTMLAKVTDMAVNEIEQQREVSALQRELQLQEELKLAGAQLAERARETELVVDVTRALSGTLDLHEQLEELGKSVCQGLGADEFSVLLVDEPTHQLVCEAVAGSAPSAARGVRLAIGEGVAGEAVARGETLYVPDVRRDERFLHYKGKKQTVGSFLAVPLRSKGRIVGVMNINRPQVGAFTPQEIRVAESVAMQAAMAISNARLFQQTLELSYTDPLTGIPNRRHLFQQLEQEWTRSLRFGDELSLLMIDLDLFKNVNDTWGHAIGDGVLRAIAQVLRRNVRKVDTVARYGGEEFCVLLPRVTKREAIEVAEKLRRAVATTPLPGAPDQQPIHLTISVGVATYGADASDMSGLIESADKALYAAKHAGRNAVQAAGAR
jgi:diguanylate cyclase (GGDEF)-like protein